MERHVDYRSKPETEISLFRLASKPRPHLNLRPAAESAATR
jgi:hypothetical protein